jgi:Mg2+/Co2+ transporter CorB
MLLISVICIILLLAFSSFLAAAETAITASSPGKIQKLKAKGNLRADLVLMILKTKEQVISTLLIGNSLINTICTTMATGIFIEWLGDNLGTIVSSAVMAIVIIVFAEVVPKAIAVAKAEEIAIFASPIIRVFLRILRPLNYVLDLIIKIFCYIFKINLKSTISGTDEVRGVIEHHHQEGNVYKVDRDMLGGVLDIRDMVVSEIMVHRSSMVSIDIDLPNEEIISYALSSAYTRIPVWKNNQENVIGVLHIKDLLRKLYDSGNDLKNFNIKDSITEPWFIPDHALVIQQLNAFRDKKNHLAIVVDEYGGLQGIITLEDILEEIVGQIYDEHDSFIHDIRQKSETEFIIDGATTIRDLNRELNWNLPDDNANTIAGFIIFEMKKIPNQGEVLKLDNMHISIIKKMKNRIKTVRINLLSNFNTDSD